MTRVCAWCQQLLGAPGPADSPITHGICDPCAERWFAEEPGDALEQLQGPVLMLDASGRILDTNGRAFDMLDQAILRGRLFGDAAACRNAALPGGCGQTPDCQHCELRAVFEHTARTGEAAHGVRTEIPRDARSVLTVTTERVGAAVLLRVDGMDEGSGR